MGGFLGALCRNAVFNIPFLAGFQAVPLNTIAVNLLGCFLLSLAVHLAERSISLGDNLHAAMTTGFLGAFTTFSTFSKNLGDMIVKTDFTGAAIYMAVSLIGGFFLVYLGYLCAGAVASRCPD